MSHDPVDPRAPRMESVKAHFMHDKQKDHHAYGNTNSQPEDIDDRKGFIFHQIPPGDCKIVFDHNVECEGLNYHETSANHLFRLQSAI
jgi:hypothetical protein